MKTTLLLASALALCLLFLPACSGARRSASGTTALEVEARGEAEKFWFAQITKCGNSYYRSREIKDAGAELFEIKEPRVRLAP